VSAPTPSVLDDNALRVLRRRYLIRDATGEVVEQPDEMFRRVAEAVATADAGHGATAAEVRAVADRFHARMAALEFLPNSPTLMNAGRPLGQLAACFVVPVGDSTEAIFAAVGWAAAIQKTGGGTGFDFSRLRPAGDRVESTGGLASGPVAFAQVFDVATEAVKQGGTRRGANMGILRVDHPDILDFVGLKLDPQRMRNFNLSVAITDRFMAALAAGHDYPLINPRTGEAVRSLSAARVWSAIVNAAWTCGDPGLVFIDRVNRDNPTPALGDIAATNPCVTGDTRILVADRGWIPIRELVGSTPRVASGTGAACSFNPATAVVRTGIRPVYRIRTVEGFELRATADHRVATEDGDVAVADLEPGDRIPLLQAEEPPPPADGDDARFGEVVGWLTGDGHFTVHSADKPTVVLSFYGADKHEAAPRLHDTVRQLIGDPRLQLVAVSDRDLLMLRSSRLRAALAERGVDEGCKQRVPEVVWRGSAAVVAGYLRALFSADGSVQGTQTKGISVRLAASHLDLLRDTQLLLLRLGVISVIYPNRREQGYRTMPDADGQPRDYLCAAQHELVVARASLRTFADSVGFLVAAKQQRLGDALASYARGPYRDRRAATVASVERDGEEEVFDLTEPRTSHFFASGLLVHNCGEQPLLPFESCTLGSINLARFVDGDRISWVHLAAAIHDGVHFLDDVIDVNRYPLEQIATATRATRKVGLGVMGFADALIALGVPYDSEQAVALAGEIASFLDRESLAASEALAVRRGPFPAWPGSRWAAAGRRLRNATTTTVAPTGTISILAGCSSGIEPLFAIAYQRHVLDGEVLPELHAGFRARAQVDGFWSDALAAELARSGRVRGLDLVPAAVQTLYATAHDLSAEVHLRMQAAFQRHVHAGVSKTINLPGGAAPADVDRAYRLADQLGCKGVTVYRDRSRAGQVLATGAEAVTGPAEHCPECGAVVGRQQGCAVCRNCGWSVCG